jgi:hypothetical protein
MPDQARAPQQLIGDEKLQDASPPPLLPVSRKGKRFRQNMSALKEDSVGTNANIVQGQQGGPGDYSFQLVTE